MNRAAIVVLNWNGIQDTLLCLDSLLQQTYDDYHIVVVDNGSNMNDVRQLEDYQKQNTDIISVIYNKKNLGFAGGVNTGIRWALKNSYSHIALFNNDALAKKEWLSSLMTAIKANKTGIATGLLLHQDGKTIDSSGDWYSKWGLPFPRNRGDHTVFASKDGFVFGASGGATLYKSELFNDIGLFDEDFFAYYEDVDISFRAQLAGWKVAYTSTAVAYHKQGATSSKIPGFTVYQTFKNLPWLFIKNVPLRLALSIGVHFYTAYTLMFWNAVLHGSGWSAFKGVLKSILLTPKKISERQYIQKKNRVSSSYIKNMLWDDLPPDQTGLRKLRKKITGK